MTIIPTISTLRAVMLKRFTSIPMLACPYTLSMSIRRIIPPSLLYVYTWFYSVAFERALHRYPVYAEFVCDLFERQPHFVVQAFEQMRVGENVFLTLRHAK